MVQIWPVPFIPSSLLLILRHCHLFFIVLMVVYITAAPRGFEYIEIKDENLIVTQVSLHINKYS